MADCISKDDAPMSGPAPNLDDYFKLIIEVSGGTLTSALADLTTLVVQALVTEDEAKSKELSVKMKKLMDDCDKMKEPLGDIIRKSFDFHDTAKNGVLDKEESQLFFQHFVERYVPAMSNITIQILDEALEVQLNMFKDMFGANTEEFNDAKERMTKKINDGKPGLMAGFKAKGDAYKKNKAAMDKAAFAVLDVSGDGKLQKEEVVEGLFDGTDKHDDFAQALGLYTPEETVQVKQMTLLRKKLADGTLTVDDLKAMS